MTLSTPDPQLGPESRRSRRMFDPNDALGATLRDRYRLRRILGQGGMGTVYLADDLRHDRKVAIKTIRPDLTNDGIRARFEREIRITAHLQHPHILPLLDSGRAGQTLFYVMPFVEGESLRRRLQRAGAMPIDEAIRMALDVVEGLEEAHARGVVHRDIKPENILLTDRYAVIADFGIAKALGQTDDTARTGTGLWLGSPNYMAPEQACGVAGPRADLYALGCVLYEAMTGHRATDTRRGWEDIPDAVCAIIERATRESPADRWEDAASFRHALESISGSTPGGRGRGAGLRMRRLAIAPRVALGLVAVVLAVGAGLARHRAEPAVPTSLESLAVLPLANLIGDPEEEYFVAGVHEAFISELARIRQIRVISRTSVARYAETQLSIGEIGAELGVAAILEGGVRRSGGRVHVDVQLIDVDSDQHLWVESYDEPYGAGNLFQIQRRLAARVAASLRATLRPARGPPTESLEAYDLHARARYLYNRFASHQDRLRAVDLFQQAIEIDSAYALAHAGLAEAYAFLGGQGYLPAEEAIPRARAAAERALALDETIAEGHAALGGVLMGEQRYEDAESAFKRAVDLNPNSADVRRQYSRLLNRLGRSEESVREARMAVELDPLSIGNRVSLASRLFFARDFKGAAAEARKVLEMEPDDTGALFFLGGAYVLSGRHADGISALERVRELDPDNPFRVTMLAWGYARAGRHEAAIRALATVPTEGRLLKELAIVHAELGDLDLAFAYVERALSEDPVSLSLLRSDPTADALQRDPRFEAMLRRAGR